MRTVGSKPIPQRMLASHHREDSVMTDMNETSANHAYAPNLHAGSLGHAWQRTAPPRPIRWATLRLHVHIHACFGCPAVRFVHMGLVLVGCSFCRFAGLSSIMMLVKFAWSHAVVPAYSTLSL